VIANDRQYEVTKEQARKLAEALASDQPPSEGIDLRLLEAEREGIASLLADMERELAEYEQRRRVRHANEKVRP